MQPSDQPIELGVSEFVALLNQTLEFTYSNVVITGELANLRVSKNRWVYFDLKDDDSTVKFFGTVYQLPGPLEDGMILKVRGLPKLHNLYGFSVNVMTISLAGEGSIRRAADLLKAKLIKEGLFDASRKRQLPYPPQHIGIVTSLQSAAYADFTKVLNARWRGLQIDVIDVQVQGEPAPAQIVSAIEQFNALAEPPEVLVLIRGGGSAEDLAAFSSEIVTRAVAASRVLTLVAIGHEIDQSLAELAADLSASTPSNAAELLVPDRQQASLGLESVAEQLFLLVLRSVQAQQAQLLETKTSLGKLASDVIFQSAAKLDLSKNLLEALNPRAVLARGYSIVSFEGQPIHSTKLLKQNAIVEVTMSDGIFSSEVKQIKGEEV